MLSFILLFILFSSVQCFSPLTSYYQSYTQLTKSIQSSVINPTVFTPLNITTKWYDSKTPFFFSKPYFGKHKDIHIQAYLEKGEGPILWLKTKNQGAYTKEFGKIQCGDQTTALSINKMIMANEIVRNVDKELNICYLDDVLFGEYKNTVFDWIKYPLFCNYNYDEETLYLQSPVMLTSENLPLKRYAGMYYMKVLTPAFAHYLVQTYGKPKNIRP